MTTPHEKKQQLFRKVKWKKKYKYLLLAHVPLHPSTSAFHPAYLTLHSTGGGKSVKLRICDMAFVEEAQASSIVLAGLGT